MIKHNWTDAVFMIDGKEICKLTPLNLEADIEREREIKSGDDLKLFNKNYAITMTNVQVNPEFAHKLIIDQKFKVVGEGYKFPRNRLPKKKRIRNKWLKKYKREFVLDDCRLL